MAEEFKKYKVIISREQKEFREEMGREVSAFLPFQLVKEKQDLKRVDLDFVMNFVIFSLLNFVICSNIIFGYYSRG